jgi:hypothetical protein
LGHGDVLKRLIPVLISTLNNIIQISAGKTIETGTYSMALHQNGNVYGFGLNDVFIFLIFRMDSLD